MNPFDDLREDRALRKTAKDTFDAHLAQVKADLAARGIGGRMADTVTGEAKAAGVKALEIADDNRSVVAATVGALGLWLARKPLRRGIDALIARFRD